MRKRSLKREAHQESFVIYAQRLSRIRQIYAWLWQVMHRGLDECIWDVNSNWYLLTIADYSRLKITLNSLRKCESRVSG